MKNGKTTFEEVAELFGYGKAVVAFNKYLPANLWRDMTIRQQVLVYIASVDNQACSELATMIAARLSSVSVDFNGWREIYTCSQGNKYLQDLALEKMIGLANLPEQWEVIYLMCPSGDDQKRIALNKIGRLTAKSE